MWRRRPNRSSGRMCPTDKGYHSPVGLEGARRRPILEDLSRPGSGLRSPSRFGAFALALARRARGCGSPGGHQPAGTRPVIALVAREAFKLRAEIVERSFAHNPPRSRRYAPDLASGPRAWSCTSLIPVLHVARPQPIVADAPTLIGAGTPIGGRGNRAELAPCSCWLRLGWSRSGRLQMVLHRLLERAISKDRLQVDRYAVRRRVKPGQ